MVELKTSDSGHLKKIVTENEDVTEIEETGHETAGNEMVPAGKENQCEKIEDILVNNNGVWTWTCQVRSRSGPGQVQVRSRTGLILILWSLTLKKDDLYFVNFILCC